MAQDNGFDCDVFISYSSRDKEWVRGELLRRIEEAGLKVFIDCQDCRPGGASIAECERGVRKSRVALLILTPEYLASRWCIAETNMILTLDPDGSKGRIIPLLRRECEKPLRIASLSHIDFTEALVLDRAWRQLLTALGAPPEPKPVKQPERSSWFIEHPYAMPADFTGRADERAMLTDWLEADAAHPLLVLRALGGFGKSALSWYWLMHDVQPSKWPRIVWWSFSERDASFESFLAGTLDHLTNGTAKPEEVAGKNAAIKLLKLLDQPGTLLVLDGFERALRAFGGINAAYQGDEEKTRASGDGNERDCISLLAHLFMQKVALQPGIRAKVLVTTRLLPKALEHKTGGLLQGCREAELFQMRRGDAVAFFHTKGIRGSRAEIEAACAPYGYHPLSLGLLAGLILRDFQQAGDIAAAKRLSRSGDIVQCQHNVLQQAYDSLSPERRRLLGRIACFRGPVDYNALRGVALVGSNGQSGRATAEGTGCLDSLDTDLRDLFARGLLHHDTKANRFDLHPIVRRYAYDRLTTQDRKIAHMCLRDYFGAIPNLPALQNVEDLMPVIELYHHMAQAGQYEDAYTLFSDRIAEPTFYRFGAYGLHFDLLQALLPGGEEMAPELKKSSSQGWVINQLALCCSHTGQPRRAVTLFKRVISLEQSVKNKKNLVVVLSNLAHMAQLHIGALRAADSSLRRSIALCQEIRDNFKETVGRRELGRVLAYRGLWNESAVELATALAFAEHRPHLQGQTITWAYRALRELLVVRHNKSLQPAADYKMADAISAATQASELLQKSTTRNFARERDSVRICWIVGAAFGACGELGKADRYLSEALERCRRINLVEIEADILVELGRVRIADRFEEAAQLAEEALTITERSGYVLQGADAHLVLAELAKGKGDRDALLHHATEAKRLATCDGPPDYTYKAAYDEACAMLAAIE